MTDLARFGVVVDPQGAEQGSARVKRSFNDMQDSARNTTAGLATLQNRLISLRGVMLAVAGTAIAGALVGGMRAAIAVGADFTSSISELSAITGATGEDLQFLSDAAREMGASTTFSATQAATAFKLIASAKPDLLENSEALAETTRQTLLLAEAAGITLPEAANTLGLALNQFGASANEANRFVNTLAAGAKFGASEIFETAQAIRDSGTAAAGANISFEELNAAIQVLAQAGLRGARAGTSLRNIFIILESQADRELRPSVVGLSQALENLRDRNLDVTETLKIFGRENINQAQILQNNIEKFDDLVKNVTGTNTAIEQATVRFDNLEGDTRRLSSALGELGQTIFESIEEPLRDATQASTDFIINFTNVMKTFRGELEKPLSPEAERMLRALRPELFSLEGGGLVPEGISATEAERRRAGVTGPPPEGVVIPGAPEDIGAETDATEENAASKKEFAEFTREAEQQMRGLIEIEERGIQVTNQMRTEEEKLTATILEMNELLAAGVISRETYNRAIEQSVEAAVDATAANETFTSSVVELDEETQDRLRRIEAGARGAFSNFEDAAIDAAKGTEDAFSRMTEAIIEDLARLAIQESITQPLFSGFQGLLQEFLSPSTGTTPLPPGGTQSGGGAAQHGTEFLVGGSGGVDSQFVSFRATPGERVRVSPPNKDSDGRSVQINDMLEVNIINAPSQPETNVRRTPRGRTLDIIFRDQINSVLGQGGADQVMFNRFGLRPTVRRGQ